MGKFQKGNPGKQKGTISEKTKFWNEMKDFMVNEGAERFKEELMRLKGSQFVYAYSNALEYFQPKLSRAEIKAEVEEIGIKTYKIVNASGDNKDK